MPPEIEDPVKRANRLDKVKSVDDPLPPAQMQIPKSLGNRKLL